MRPRMRENIFTSMKRPLRNKAKTVEIPTVIYTDQFLRFLAYYAKKFKADNGYGRWLVEYKYMEEHGMFKPEKLKELYIKILDGSNELTFIYKDAVRFICVQALDAAKIFVSAVTCDIRIITGEIAVNDNDEELTGLSMDEAIFICNAMNQEAEELLFKVYNSITNKPIK